MQENSHIIFRLNNDLYGIKIAYVEEFFYLPELIPIPQAPRQIVGAVNLRGNIVIIMDLHFTFGYQTPDYSLSDILVVFKSEESRFGIIVNQVYEVKDIYPEEITTEFDYQRELMTFERIKIINGLASIPENILILNNPKKWFEPAYLQQLLSFEYTLDEAILSSNNTDKLNIEQSIFCPNATLEERMVFRERAENLKLSGDSENLKTFITLAVISLNGNLFGLDLEIVREFTDIYQVTPIPCCPPHIIGNINLRGEILTLIDIRRLLNLFPTDINNNSKAIVVEVEGIVAGVVVEEVCDVMFSLNLSEIMPVSTTNDKYLQGTAFYDEKNMSILDLPKIFLKGGLIVDEVI